MRGIRVGDTIYNLDLVEKIVFNQQDRVLMLHYAVSQASRWERFDGDEAERVWSTICGIGDYVDVH